MSLREKIDADIKKAMMAKQKEELTALRSIKSMILLASTEKGGKEGISEEVEMKILAKALKQRKDSADIYKEQGREDLYEKEIQEVSIIEKYMPEQMSEEDIRAALQKVVEEVGANGPQDMGKVMGKATQLLAGKADGKTISTLVKDLLTK